MGHGIAVNGGGASPLGGNETPLPNQSAFESGTPTPKKSPARAVWVVFVAIILVGLFFLWVPLSGASSKAEHWESRTETTRASAKIFYNSADGAAAQQVANSRETNALLDLQIQQTSELIEIMEHQNQQNQRNTVMLLVLVAGVLVYRTLQKSTGAREL